MAGGGNVLHTVFGCHSYEVLRGTGLMVLMTHACVELILLIGELLCHQDWQQLCFAVTADAADCNQVKPCLSALWQFYGALCLGVPAPKVSGCLIYLQSAYLAGVMCRWLAARHVANVVCNAGDASSTVNCISCFLLCRYAPQIMASWLGVEQGRQVCAIEQFESHRSTCAEAQSVIIHGIK